MYHGPFAIVWAINFCNKTKELLGEIQSLPKSPNACLSVEQPTYFDERERERRQISKRALWRCNVLESMMTEFRKFSVIFL